MKEIISKIKLNTIIRVLLFSLISIILMIVLIKINFSNKNINTNNIKINLDKGPRDNYPKTESLWGVIEIPSLKIKTNLYKGSDELLKFGALHNSETYFPTDGKVILISASNKYFKDLDKVEKNSAITLNTIYGTYEYKVYKIRKRKTDYLKEEIKNIDTETLILYSNLNENERIVVYAR